MLLRPARVWLASLALAAAACSGSGDAEPADPNQPAGKVVELAGQVSAARAGAATRPLAVGAQVYSDDTVTTGTDGSAVILLAHNQVRWNLGSGKSLRVDRSMAWKAKADESGSAFDDEDEMATASAGRHTDREAGDTAATAQLPTGEEGAAETAPTAPPDMMASAEERPPTPPSSSKPPTELKQTGSKGSGMVAQKSTGAGNGALEDRESAGVLRGSPGGGGDGASGGGGGVGGGAAAAVSVPATGNLVLGKLTVKGALSAAQISPRLASFSRRCTGDVPGKATIRIDIDATGAVKSARVTGTPEVTASISSCLTGSARALRFPTARGTTTVEREITIAPAK
ncbi:MAG TPA: hypothetical protein VIG06_14740 [Kofleriaceae bacterium]